MESCSYLALETAKKRPEAKFIERKNDILKKFACSDGATICLYIPKIKSEESRMWKNVSRVDKNRIDFQWENL